jgi:hypothetical protein
VKLGDIVRKTKGDHDLDRVGMIVEIITNKLGNTIVTVQSEVGLRKWYANLTEVISETHM